MSEIKIMSHEDKLIFRDEQVNNSAKQENVLVFKDAESGEILLVRKNLVVRRGRENTLRKLFAMPYGVTAINGVTMTPSSGTETIQMLNERVVNTFGIGKGGTPQSDPFNPYPPTPADQDLSAASALRIATTTNPLTPSELLMYTDRRQVTGDASKFMYMKKTFTKQEIVMNDDTNDYFVKLQLDISNLDARDTVVSELALYSSRYIGGNYSDFKIFSRVTFPTEALYAVNNKALSIDYYVYA